MPGPDHSTSLEPDEFKMMVKAIKDTRIILGSWQKEPSKSEVTMLKSARKSLVALCPINKGEIFTVKNVGIKRPGTGLSPSNYFKILGKKAKQNIKADSLIN